MTMPAKHINLLAPHLRRATHRFSLKMMVYAIAGIAATVFAIGNLQNTEVTRLASVSKALDADVKRLEETIKASADAAAAKKPSPELEREATALEDRLQLQRKIATALETGGLGDTRGFGEYLTALARARAEGVWLTQFAMNAGDNKVFIRGRALRPDLVPAYFKLLSNETVFRGRAFDDVQLKESQEAARPAAGAADVASKTGASERRTVIEFTLGVPVAGAQK